MSESVIEEAIRRRDEAFAEARRWDDFVKMYEDLSGRTTRQPANMSQPMQVERTTSNGAVLKKTRGDGALAKTEHATVAILRKSGRPIKTSDLLELLLAQGVEVGGQSPAATLSARLSRSTNLVNNRSSGWWFRNSTDGNLVGTQVPPVGNESLGDSQAEPRA